MLKSFSIFLGTGENVDRNLKAQVQDHRTQTQTRIRTHFVIAVVFVFVFVLQSCTVDTTGTWINENIEPDVREEIKALDKVVITSISSKDVNRIKKISSEKLMEKYGSELDKYVGTVSKIVNTEEYTVLDQYHVRNSSVESENSVFPKSTGDDAYTLKFKPLNEESFVSLLISGSELGQGLITCIYGKYPEGWKLNTLQFGAYKMNGMTAPELFRKAKSDLDKGYWIDAANSMRLCSYVANPANEHWKYAKEDSMIKFSDRLIEDLKKKYQFPLEVSSLKSSPKIIAVTTKGIDEGYFPLVDYLSNIPLKDTIATKKENDLLHSEIENVFPGISKNKKYVFYRAFSEMPEGDKKVKTFGFVKTME